MQMYSRNALRWVISAIPLFPLPYNGALQVFNTSELRGVMSRMCPRFPVHYLVLLQSQKPQVLMAIFFTRCLCQLLTGCSDSLGPTVHAHARTHLSLPLSVLLKSSCEAWCAYKNLFLPQRVRGGERQRVMERQGYVILIKQWQNGGCYMNGRIIGWRQQVSTVAPNPCIN